jgi:hypothetical protein
VRDAVRASGYPAVTTGSFRVGPLVLAGWGPAVEGVAEAYCPRRTMLDTILVKAASAPS